MGIFNSLLKGLGFDTDNKNQDNAQSYENDIVIKNNTERKNEKSVSINNLLTYEPKSNSDVKKLVDCLKKGDACILNLNNLKQQEQTRILDFLSGAVYAISGKINRLQNSIYVVLPPNVNIAPM